MGANGANVSMSANGANDMSAEIYSSFILRCRLTCATEHHFPPMLAKLLEILGHHYILSNNHYLPSNNLQKKQMTYEAVTSQIVIVK